MQTLKIILIAILLDCICLIGLNQLPNAPTIMYGLTGIASGFLAIGIIDLTEGL